MYLVLQYFIKHVVHHMYRSGYLQRHCAVTEKVTVAVFQLLVEVLQF